MSDTAWLEGIVRREVRRLAPYRLATHREVLKLDQNESAFGPPPAVREALAEAARSAPLHRYPELANAELRAALGALEDWPAEGVLVGNGSNELLFLLAATCLEPGRVALAPSPSFHVYEHAARVMGARTRLVELGPELDYDVEAVLEAIAAERPAVVFLCSPNNPTGTALAEGDLRRILAAAPGLVVVDEAYVEFASFSARSLLGEHRRLVVTRTFSKAMGLAGLRIGYALAEPELARLVATVQLPFAVDVLSRVAALAACRSVEEIRRRARSVVAERGRLHERLEGLPGVRPYPSEANFILFECPRPAETVFRGLLERGVLVRDVGRHPRLARCLRVTVGRREDNDRFLAALEEVLGERG